MRLDDLTINLRMVDKTAGAFRSLSSRVRNLEKAFVKVKIAAAAISVAAIAVGTALASVFSNRAPYLDNLGKTADTLGLGVEQLQAFRREAELSGISVDTLDKSLLKMNRNIGEAISGTGAAADALEDLGLDANTLATLNPEEAFTRITDALRDVPTLAQRSSLAMDIFGKKGAEVLRITGDGLSNANDELEEFGLKLTRVDIAGIEAANDAIFKVQQNFTGVKDVLTARLAPVVVAVSNLILDMSKGLVGATEDGADFATKLVRGFGFIGDAFNGFLDGIDFIRLVINGLELLIADVLISVSDNFSNFIAKFPGGEKLVEAMGIREFAQSMRVESASIIDDIDTISTSMNDRFAAGPVSARLEAFYNTALADARLRGQEIADAVIDGFEAPSTSQIVNVGARDPVTNVIVGLDAANDPVGGAFPSTPLEDPEVQRLNGITDAADNVSTAMEAASGAFDQFGNSAGEGASKAFKAFQATQIAIATVAGISAQIQSLAAIDAPTVFQKVAAYAQIGAIVAGGIASLRAVTIGGGSSSASGSSGALPATPNNTAVGGLAQQTQSAQPQRRVTVNITGNGNYTPEQVEEIIEAINDNDSTTQIDSRRIAA